MERFRNGDRVCFVGDSLVAHNQYLPRIIDHYKKHFPNEKIRFFNCGTSGGTCKGAMEFFEDDVIIHNPTHVVLAFGINDSGRDMLINPRSTSRLDRLVSNFETYKKSIREYTELVRSRGIKLIVCTPAPYDEYTPGDNPGYMGGFALMLGYADFIRAFAKEIGAELYDNHAYLSYWIETDCEQVYSPDRVHPNPHGYYLIAKGFLQNQGLIIDEEAEIPTYLDEWRDLVARLRVIYGAEHMIVKNYKQPTDEKIARLEKKIETENWGNPVLERFIRGFVAEKRNQDILYRMIDEVYERDVIG